MTATLLHRGDVAEDITGPDNGEIDLDEFGTWEDSQDPLTGQVVKIWQPYPAEPTYYPGFQPPGQNNSNTVTVRENISCIARGIVDGGIRVAGTTERYGETYENVDFVRLWVPGNTLVTKRDRITNIRDRSGRVRWLDEEYYVPGEPDSLRATVFNVNGVTPLFDAFNNVVEQFILLERASDS